MVGTRHAVSDNNSKSGLGMPSPYNPEREQIQDRKAGLKRKTENCSLSSPSIPSILIIPITPLSVYKTKVYDKSNLL